MKRKKPSEIEWIPSFKYVGPVSQKGLYESLDVNQKPTKGEKMRDVKKRAINSWRIHATKRGITNEKNRYLYIAGFTARDKKAS